MKTKAEVFWDKVDSLIYHEKTSLKEFCKNNAIVYGTVMSNKSRKILPSIDIASNFAKGLRVSVDDLISDSEITMMPVTDLDRRLDELRQKQENRESDLLYDLLDEQADLKALVWRLAQCSTIQLRAIKTMLVSWGIGEYDALGNSKAVASS